MLAGSESDLQRMMDRLNMVSVNYNIKINTKKTKILRVGLSKGSESDNEDSSCMENCRTSQGILKFPKTSIFQAILQKNIEFCRQISENFDFFQAIKKIRFSKQKIVHLQLPLCKLFYFSSKVTTFEHTSCTMIRYNNIS